MLRRGVIHAARWKKEVPAMHYPVVIRSTISVRGKRYYSAISALVDFRGHPLWSVGATWAETVARAEIQERRWMERYAEAGCPLPTSSLDTPGSQGALLTIYQEVDCSDQSTVNDGGVRSYTLDPNERQAIQHRTVELNCVV